MRVLDVKNTLHYDLAKFKPLRAENEMKGGGK